jgi:hypothetical protein
MPAMGTKLEQLQAELGSTQSSLTERGARLAAALELTNTYWRDWSEKWSAILRMLEERGRALEAPVTTASEMVTLAEDQLDDTEAALREWLAAAAITARRTAAES